MDALVTGGAGFIGSHIVDALVARGDAVRVLDDLSTGRAENVNPGAELIDGSIVDASVVANAVAGVEVVFHLGALGAVARSVADPRASNAANVDGTLNVLTEARDAGVRRDGHPAHRSRESEARGTAGRGRASTLPWWRPRPRPDSSSCRRGAGWG